MQGQRAGPDDGAPVGARRHTVQGGGLEKVARWPVSPRLALCGTGVLSFKLTFSLSSFTVIKRLFSSSSLSDIRVVSSAYLRLLIFLPAILILAVIP